MKDLIDAAKAVIEYWNRSWPMGDKLIQLRAAVERAEQGPENEPVAWLSIDGYVYRSYTVAKHSHHGQEPTPLYRHPRQPVRLSDEEIDNVCFVWRCRGTHLTELVRDMETAFIEKNQ